MYDLMVFQWLPETTTARRRVLKFRCCSLAASAPSRMTVNRRRGPHSCMLADRHRGSRLLVLDTVQWRPSICLNRVGFSRWEVWDPTKHCLWVAGSLLRGWPSWMSSKKMFGGMPPKSGTVPQVSEANAHFCYLPPSLPLRKTAASKRLKFTRRQRLFFVNRNLRTNS